MPKKHGKKSNRDKNERKHNKKKKKVSSSSSYNTWWIISFVMVAIISVIIYFYVEKSALFLGPLGQPKTPAKKQQIEQLSHAINNLQSIKIESLVSEFQYDFNNIQNAQIIELESLFTHFFKEWSQRINDNQYDIKTNILEILITNTNIYEQTILCICNHAIKYRLIDALKLILSAMSASSINECFSYKSPETNDTMFHQVTKSKSASFARLILKMGYKNPKMILAAKRLYFDIPKSYINRPNSIVLQSDIKKMQSPIDIEMVISAAKQSMINDDWFLAKNSENYTGYDYWILNDGKNKNSQLLTEKKLTKHVAESINTEHCNFNEEVLFNNSCSPQIIYNWNDFDLYWKQQRPVIIKNVLHLNDVNLNSLIENFGNLNVMVSEIPYAPLFGQKAWSIPIKEYINVILNGEHSSNLYAFDKEMVSSNTDFQNFFNFSIPYMNDDEIKNKYNKTYQLALGPKNSGAPPHWHQPAFNGLFLGKKMWWMFTPKTSMYSSMSVNSWISNQYKQKMIKKGEVHRHYCFVQNKGDVVFVPHEWSHAVNNVLPSLAVAIEFNV